MQSLEELLIQTRLLSSPQVAVAQRDAHMRHKRLAPTLIDLGLVKERQFADWMAEVTDLPIVEPLPADDVARHERRLPRALARKFEVVPLSIEDGVMTVATIDPLDRSCLEVLRTTTGMEIRPVIAIYGSLMHLVTRFYPEDDAEPTMLPNPVFEWPGTHPTQPSENQPFEFGSETLLGSHKQPFVLHEDDDSLGSSTKVVSPKHTVAVPMTLPDPSQLDRIEQTLAELRRTVEALQRRVEDIDSAVARMQSRKQ